MQAASAGDQPTSPTHPALHPPARAPAGPQLLFMQQAVKGSVQEFRRGADSPAWQLVNGLWSLVLAGGLLGASLALRGARSCRFLRAPARGLLADYGAALMLVAFSGLSFAVRGGGAPSRVSAPNVWQVKDTWTVAAVSAQRCCAAAQHLRFLL